MFAFFFLVRRHPLEPCFVLNLCGILLVPWKNPLSKMFRDKLGYNYMEIYCIDSSLSI